MIATTSGHTRDIKQVLGGKGKAGKGAAGPPLDMNTRAWHEGADVFCHVISLVMALDDETKCHTGVRGKRRPPMPHGSGLRKANHLHALVPELGPKAVAVDKSAKR
jgi:hypothetical protein